ncbi:DUF202 domain-containing protein [Cupriavidus necator]|uniref:DUF202 domain-containing protein n=1 Tax=Cupriavidus necator TaxID=106590 RepID=UPI003F733F29
MNGDPGVQPERTGLAWRRTALSMLLNGALLVRSAMEAQSVVLRCVSALVVVGALFMYAMSWYRDRSLMRVAVPRSPHAAIMRTVVSTVLFACLAAVIAIDSR